MRLGNEKPSAILVLFSHCRSTGSIMSPKQSCTKIPERSAFYIQGVGGKSPKHHCCSESTVPSLSPDWLDKEGRVQGRDILWDTRQIQEGSLAIAYCFRTCSKTYCLFPGPSRLGVVVEERTGDRFMVGAQARATWCERGQDGGGGHANPSVAR